MEDKELRQSALRRLLDSREITSQAEIVDLLKKSGVMATQSSVSRDIRELGVLKVGGRYWLPEESIEESIVPADESFKRVRRFVLKMRAVSDQLLVIKTNAAAAHVVAALIDHLHSDGIAGTVAGDDTVFVATMNREAQMYLEKCLMG